jgi:hypothetical protein
MRAEHLRKFRKFGDGLKWHFQCFLSQGPTSKRQNKSLFHQKYADFEDFLENTRTEIQLKFLRGDAFPAQAKLYSLIIN